MVGAQLGSHQHCQSAWAWFREIEDAEVAFCRFTQVGLLRLLNTKAIMGPDCRTVGQAWDVYDLWLRDPTVCFIEDPPDVTARFRMITAPPAGVSAPKAMGDCYLLALSQATGSTLVTFDAGLAALARKAHLDVVLLD